MYKDPKATHKEPDVAYTCSIYIQPYSTSIYKEPDSMQRARIQSPHKNMFLLSLM